MMNIRQDSAQHAGDLVRAAARTSSPLDVVRTRSTDRERDDSQSAEPAAHDLPIVKAAGFLCYSDAGAAGAEGEIHYLSLCGLKPAVVSVSSAVRLERESTRVRATVYPHPTRPGFEAICPRAWAYRETARTLPGGGFQSLLLPARADYTRLDPRDGQFTLLALPPDSAVNGNPGPALLARLHYRFLTRLLSTPLAPEWDQWLWTRAGQREEATPLPHVWGWLTAAYSCHPDEAALRVDITAALHGAMAFGPLPVPTTAAGLSRQPRPTSIPREEEVA